MKTNQIINLIIIIFLIGCKDNISYLESKEDNEARYIITKYQDSIFISYTKYEDKIILRDPLIRVGEDFWYTNDSTKDNSGLVSLSSKTISPNVFFSKKKHSYLIKDQLARINDSILIYSENGKYITERRANEKPVKYYYYYKSNYNIDSIVVIVLNDTIIYK